MCYAVSIEVASAQAKERTSLDTCTKRGGAYDTPLFTAPPPASTNRLMELLADARDYVVAFEKDKTDGHIASSLVGKIDAVLVDFYVSRPAAIIAATEKK